MTPVALQQRLLRAPQPSSRGAAAVVVWRGLGPVRRPLRGALQALLSSWNPTTPGEKVGYFGAIVVGATVLVMLMGIVPLRQADPSRALRSTQ